MEPPCLNLNLMNPEWAWARPGDRDAAIAVAAAAKLVVRDAGGTALAHTGSGGSALVGRLAPDGGPPASAADTDPVPTAQQAPTQLSVQ